MREQYRAVRNRFQNLFLQTAVLAMFVLSGSGVLPCLLGTMAEIDGGHSVGLTRAGGLTLIVLGHTPDAGAQAATAAKAHDHSLMAVVMVAFSEAEHGDHVIAFSQSEFSREAGVRQVSTPGFVALLQPPLPTSARFASAHFFPSVSPITSISRTRSMVLRI